MSFHHSPKIVTDGLILCLDAADLKSYSGSGTTWSDRTSNNYDATISSGVVYDSKSFDFDGSTTALCRTTLPASVVDNYCTVIVTCRCDNYGFAASGATRLISLDRTSGSTKWCIATKNTGGIQFCGGGGTDSIYTFDIELGEIFQVALVLNNTNYILYKNAIEKINQTSNPAPASFDNLSIGSRPVTTDRTWNGVIYNTLIYNRLLSPEEILQNYNAQKGRFGLQ